jgi:hypothetical protein
MDLNLFNLVEIVTNICFHVPNSLGFIKQRLHYAYVDRHESAENLLYLTYFKWVLVDVGRR